MATKKQPQPDVRIIDYTSGRELKLRDARRGPYVFVVGPDPQTLFAFPDTKRLIRTWADEQEVRRKLNQARRTITKRAQAPGAVVNRRAERAQIKEDDRRLKAFSNKHGIPIGDPKLLRKAHRARIFDTALLFEEPGYQGTSHVFRANCADLTPYFPYGAQSCQTVGYLGVYLYEQPQYGPDPYFPAVELIGGDNTTLTPNPILSVQFF
jgi:hypothetical protein